MEHIPICIKGVEKCSLFVFFPSDDSVKFDFTSKNLDENLFIFESQMRCNNVATCVNYFGYFNAIHLHISAKYWHPRLFYVFLYSSKCRLLVFFPLKSVATTCYANWVHRSRREKKTTNFYGKIITRIREKMQMIIAIMYDIVHVWIFVGCVNL